MSADEAPAHQAALERLGLPLDASKRLALYLDTLARWSARVNLTGTASAADRVAVLIAPVVPAAVHIRGSHLLDVGSGNGSPGLVLALLRPDLQVTLLEPRLRRWAFLREAARIAGREVQVMRQRYQHYTGPRADTLTVRALRLPLDAAARLIVTTGRVLFFGAAPERDDAFVAIASHTPGLHVFERRADVPRET